jgi:CheY-like chemotaxis protein
MSKVIFLSVSGSAVEHSTAQVYQVTGPPQYGSVLTPTPLHGRIESRGVLLFLASILTHRRHRMKPAQTAKNGSKTRVLIVDDNSDTVRTTAAWLQLSGYQVAVVTDSKECISQLDSFFPDVLLLDIAKPGTSSYDLAKEIRSQPRFDKLIIIVALGVASAEDGHRSNESGCDRDLESPSIYSLSKSKNHIQL